MTQLPFGDADFANKVKKTHKERFLGEMEQIVPWPVLIRLIAPFYPEAGKVGARTRWPRCCAST